MCAIPEESIVFLFEFLVFMECNKEEAIRAKEIAEMKMQNNDFQGARKIALKAKNLFPELENISNLLTVCDVHCSAQNKISGSEKDWYGILQTEKLADEATIKKQYRKLALVLHPDKNKLPGAEAAFKMIGEANMVLSDKGKRSLYDIKCRGLVRTVVPRPPPHQVNRNLLVRKSHGIQYNIPNVSASQFSGLNHNQSTQSDLSNGRQAFWTCCPFCNIKYQYYKDLMNKALRCQKCSQPFIAFDLGAQGAPAVSNRANPGSEGSTPGSSRSQPPVSKQKQVPKQAFKVSAQSTGEFTSSHFVSEANSSRKLDSEHVIRTTEVVRGLKNKIKGNAHANTEDGNGRVGMSKVDPPKARESRAPRDKYRKRRRKFVVDSSESCDTTSSSNSEEAVFEKSGVNPAARQNSGLDNVHCHRRSSRQKQNVSYSENVSDDDFISPPKRSSERKSTDGKEEQKQTTFHEDFKVEINEKESKRKRSIPAEGSSLYGSDKAVKYQVYAEEVVTLDPGTKKFNVMDDPEFNPNLASTSEPEVYECPEPEFSDFDKDKDEKCFFVDQIWACYDTIDGMPRFYAHVRKVFSPGFKLQITWLEPNLEEQREIDWVKASLPVGCGKFIHGDTEETSDRLTFSHQIHFVKGSHTGSYAIYPRKGETWALFKDWDIGWSSDPENHKTYIFEIVEILSDFAHDTGIKFGYLAKLKGFVSLFQRTTRGGIVTFLIPPSELLRFSHRIPSFKMTGTERGGVPEGSFELDPASLPTNPNEVWQTEEVEIESINVEVNGSCSKYSDKKMKFTTGSENTSTPNKYVDYERKNYFQNETTKIGKSPRELGSSDKKNGDVYPIACLSAKHLKGLKNQTADFTSSKRRTPSGQADEEVHIAMTRSPIDLTENLGACPSFSLGSEVSEEVFYNFNGDKTEGKFQPGQIWALYSSKGRLPNNYAQIKKIEFSPFKLHAALLEPCTLMQPVGCGMFKVQVGKPKVFSPSSFSHLMRAESVKKNKHEIYPKEGEIWAIYKNRNPELLCPDLECEYDIVEVVKNNEHCREVSCLVRLTGFKSVFQPQKIQRSDAGLLKIPQDELSIFSHQIPAFQLTGEKDGGLRGCWELDPAALPGHMFCKKQDG